MREQKRTHSDLCSSAIISHLTQMERARSSTSLNALNVQLIAHFNYIAYAEFDAFLIGILFAHAVFKIGFKKTMLFKLGSFCCAS